MRKILLVIGCLCIVTITQAQVNLNTNFFIEGFYSGSGTMVEAMTNQGCSGAASGKTDLVTIELHSSTSPYGIVTNGSSAASLSTSGVSGSFFNIAQGSTQYYVVIKHRNALETWSSSTVTFPNSSAVTYDFRYTLTNAHGSRMTDVSGNGTIFALYSGDVDQSGCIDSTDLSIIDTDINNFVYGCVPTDLNGDGNTDLLDYPIAQNNLHKCVSHP